MEDVIYRWRKFLLQYSDRWSSPLFRHLRPRRRIKKWPWISSSALSSNAPPSPMARRAFPCLIFDLARPLQPICWQRSSLGWLLANIRNRRSISTLVPVGDREYVVHMKRRADMSTDSKFYSFDTTMYSSLLHCITNTLTYFPGTSTASTPNLVAMFCKVQSISQSFAKGIGIRII